MSKLLITLAILMFWSCTRQEAEQPNIIFIMTDDHACQAVGAYGSEINVTPNPDRIADQGIIFRNSLVCNSICAPGRAALLTGKRSYANGLPDKWELYDLITDPHEMNDLIDDPEYDRVETDLRRRLDGLRKLYNVPDEG